MNLAVSYCAKHSTHLAWSQWVRHCRDVQQARNHVAMQVQLRQKAQVLSALRWVPLQSWDELLVSALESYRSLK